MKTIQEPKSEKTNEEYRLELIDECIAQYVITDIRMVRLERYHGFPSPYPKTEPDMKKELIRDSIKELEEFMECLVYRQHTLTTCERCLGLPVYRFEGDREFDICIFIKKCGKFICKKLSKMYCDVKREVKKRIKKKLAERMIN